MTLKNIKEQGFTIVELLIVIVVIGILAAISVVAYTGITTNANRSAAQSNAKTVGDAADTYYSVVGSYPVITSGGATETMTLTNAALTQAGITLTLPGTVRFVDDAALTVGQSNANPALFHYDTNAGGNGYCIGYWPTGGTYTVLAGGAATGTMTNDATPTDCA